MSNIRISELAIYPVKSMRQLRLESAEIEFGGLKHDRRWMLVDADNTMITQRQQHRMCLLQPELVDNGLIISAQGVQDLHVPIPGASVTRTVSVWKDKCTAFDAGDTAAAWLSAFLNIDCRLVYFPDDEHRVVDQAYAMEGDRTAFSDGFPVLLISQASLDDLNSRMRVDLPMSRFRPNLVVSGCEAFAEDRWKKLRIGGLEMRIVKPCSRCIIPSIDIASGERGNEPTTTLLSYRKQGGKIYFGQNAVIDGSGTLTVGTQVEPIE